MPKSVIVLITAALAGIAGFAAGALLTRADRQAVEAAEQQSAALSRQNEILRQQLQASTDNTDQATTALDNYQEQNSLQVLQAQTRYALYLASLPPGDLVKQWHGSGMKTTEQFTVPQSPWKLCWQIKPHPNFEDGASMHISVNKSIPGRDSLDLISTATSTQLGWNESWVHTRGTFCFEIMGMWCDWTVCVMLPPTQE